MMYTALDAFHGERQSINETITEDEGQVKDRMNRRKQKCEVCRAGRRRKQERAWEGG